MTRDELIAALEKAAGPSRELDAEIALLFYPQSFVRSDSPGNTRGGHLVAVDEGRPVMMTQAARFTASRDAMLPGAEKLDWYIVHGRWPSEYGTAEQDDLWNVECRYPVHPDNAPPPDGLYRQYSGSAATEPLARRIAELKALVKP